MDDSTAYLVTAIQRKSLMDNKLAKGLEPPTC